MSLFAELKRRNVFRVGIAYVIATWLLLQITDVLAQILELPGWAPKLIFLILAVGFIPTLIAAWAFEMTPDGIKREKDVDRSKSITPTTGRKLDRVIIGVLVVAVALLLFDRLVPPAGQTEPVSKTVTTEIAKSIAVLPFVNMSADKDNEYFSDGLSEELLNLLAKVDGLKVAARTSSFKFKGSDSGIDEIGRALGVATVLEGSVRKSGNQARITAQLIKVDDGFHLWSETYDRSLDNIFAVQDEIAQAIVNELKLPLLGTNAAPVEASRARNFEAYDRYLLGRHSARGTTSAAFEQAIAYYRESIAADPGFAPAYSGLADAYIYLANYGGLPEGESIALAEEAVQTAIELDPNLPETITSAGLLANDQGRTSEAITLYRKAISINPNYPIAWSNLGGSLSTEGLYTESLAASRTALELDPLSDYLKFTLIGRLGESGEYEEAEQLVQSMINANPEDPFPYEGWAGLDRSRGHTADAIVHLQRAHDLRPGDTYMADYISEAYLILNDLDSARTWLAKARQRGATAQWTLEAEYRLLVFTGDVDGQVEFQQARLREQPDSPDERRLLGEALIRGGDLEAARHELERALELYAYDPANPSNIAMRAVIPLAALLDQTGDISARDELLSQADRVASRIQSDNPGHNTTYLLKAAIRAIQGQSVESLENLRAAIHQGFRIHWFLKADAAYYRYRNDPLFNTLVEEMKRSAAIERAKLEQQQPPKKRSREGFG
jgi:TolB-like protein/Flp pilus assembly protein TadD